MEANKDNDDIIQDLVNIVCEGIERECEQRYGGNYPIGQRVRTFSSIRSGSEHWVYALVVNGLEPIDAVQIPTNDLQDLISRYQQCEEMPELLVQIYMS